MKLVFPNVNDPTFIDFIYHEELLKACIEETKHLLHDYSETDFMKFFLEHGKRNRITRPVKLREILYNEYQTSSIDVEFLTTAIRIWHDAIERASIVQTEYQSGIEGLELAIMRRFIVLNDDVKYHFLVARSKFSDLSGRKGTDLFAYFDVNDDNRLLYHGRDVEELMFNMFFGFTSKYPQDKLRVGVFYFDEMLASCDRKLFKSRLFSNLITTE